MQQPFSTTVGDVLRQRLAGYQEQAILYDCGVVLSVGDGVLHLSGLGRCRYGELIAFPGDIYAMAMELSEEGVGAVLLNGVNELRVGAFAQSTGRVVEVPVGDKLIGRVIDPLGMPLDGKSLDAETLRPIEGPAPQIIHRQNVSQSLETGLLAVDSMIPIGKGQRELIIGDRQTGKTTIAVDTILNQKGKDVLCVYVAIGQKAADVAKVRETLEQAGAMEYCVIVAATAGDCAAMQYIAPYAGCAIAEHFMVQGQDALIIYDDLSKHAVAYRTMSLLLRRPPGREAYPGDVFYLHSRLLERAGRLKEELGGGSLTALPIVETMASDISAYIPTNVISITDGQIYLETELFHAGVRPAVNVGLSVSRVGRAAQKKAMRDVSGKLRLSLAQYRELQIFAQFGSDVDESTRRLLAYGNRLTEILKQPQGAPYSLSEQVVLLLLVSGGYTDGVEVSRVREFGKGLLAFLHKQWSPGMKEIDTTGELTDDLRKGLESGIKRYVASVGQKV